MSVFKCKMCGGELNIAEGGCIAVCDYCGTKQTVSKSREEVVSNLFNRANNLRLKCEFDKAEQVYEKILDIDNTDSEAHWGIVLCKYGIEYVEDPKTYTRIPTCHRTLYEAVLADVDYLAAIENADDEQKELYIAEAKAIDNLQKDILNIVNSEKPFDVFICYKETNENGKRTIDSAIANDIYHQLTQEGFKVFYAPITLEDKLGHEYEPYIFAALNSSKVMLVIGTKPEYFDSVWVRNEWSRFLKMMKTDRSKLLIPCYRDMDAYELPDEFAHLQAQDMGKIGFISDVIRGLKKVFNRDEQPQSIITEKKVKKTSKVKMAIGNIKRKRQEKAKYCLVFPKYNILKNYYLFSLLLNCYFAFKILLSNTDVELWTTILFIQALNLLMPALILTNKIRSKAISIIFQSISILPCIFLCWGFGDISYIIGEGLYLIVALITLLNLPWLVLSFLTKKVEKKEIQKSQKPWLYLLTAIVSALLIVVFQMGALPFCDYQLAKAFYRVGFYEYANDYFNLLGDYKDSSEFSKKSKLQEIKNAEYLDKVMLGHWVKENTVYDGLDYDWWYVIAKEDDKVLLLSSGNQPTSSGVNMFGGWGNSTLRTFLNSEFYEMSFSGYIKERIAPTRLVDSSNPDDVTNDKIFILSKEDVEEYLPTVSHRVAVSYDNVLLRNIESGNIYCVIYDGMFKEVKYTEIPSADVDGDGMVKASELNKHLQKYSAQKNANSTIEQACYRPAMWIDISGIE